MATDISVARLLRHCADTCAAAHLAHGLGFITDAEWRDTIAIAEAVRDAALAILREKETVS